MQRRAFRSDYKRPGRDSARAVAQAASFLAGARSIKDTTADWLAARFNLTPKRAEYMLTLAKQRRGDG